MDPLHTVDSGLRWRPIRQLGEESVQGRGVPFQFDQDIAASVPHEAVEAKMLGELIDEGAETDSLDDPADFDRTAIH